MNTKLYSNKITELLGKNINWLVKERIIRLPSDFAHQQYLYKVTYLDSQRKKTGAKDFIST